MPFVVVLEDVDVVWLAWAAGVADGKGHAAAGASLTGIIERIRPMAEEGEVDLPDPRHQQEDDFREPDFPIWGEDPLPEEAERDVDPQFMPPAVAPPMGYDVGAGPPPGGAAVVNP